MIRRPDRTEQGQALVEFALISIILFMLIFVVIEGAHLFQAQLTVQNAARAAGRYAVTGQFDETICDAAPLPCDVRLASIRAVAEEALTGLQLDPGAGFFDPAYFEIQIFGTDAAGNLIADNAGLAGQPVIIRVLYRAEVITPLLRPIAETVLVRGQTVMNNEAPVQGRTGSSGNAPAVPALPPVGPTPTIEPPDPPDLYVNKTGPTRVLINSTFQYRLQVGNLGEQEATDVVVSDTLTGGGVIASASAVCGPGTTSVACNLGTLAPGASRTITVAVQAGASVITLTNTANITGTIAEDPGTLANNDSEVQTAVVNEASTDLRLTKTGPSVDVWAESMVVFYLTVENVGLLPAVQFRVIDTLPQGITYVGSDDNCWLGAPQGGHEIVLCGAPTLAPGASTTFAIRTTAPVAAGSYTNAARVEMDPALVDSNTDNNAADFTINVVRTSDLWITKTGEGASATSTVNAGEPLTYTLQVGNLGPSTATNVTIDDILPSSVAFVSATFSAPAGNGSCMRGGDVVTCNLGTLSVGETATATIVVVPQQGGTVINSAQVSGDETDPNTVNNSAVASNTITLLTDLAIEKDAVGSDFASGEILPYLLTVINYGPSTASGVVVTDTLPANTDFYDALPSQGYCSYDAGQVDCRLGRVAANQTATVVIRVIPTQPTQPDATAIPYTNWGYVRGNEPEPPQGYSNNDSATTDVVTGPPSVLAQPSCGPAGTPVQVLGYNWRSGGSRPIVVTWRNSSGGLIEQIASLTPRTGFTIPFAVPDSTANGTYMIRAFQERQNNQDPLGDRLDEFSFKVPCDGPDLAISPIVSSPTVTQGAPITFTVDITNTGAMNANNLFYVSLYFDPTPSPVLTSTRHISSTFRQDVVAVNRLNAGASTTVTFTVESLNVAAGELPVYVVVDSDPAPEGVIAEMNELNNVAASVVTVLAGSPRPSPTPGPITLTGQTRLEVGLNLYLQPYVQVSVYGGSTWLANTFSDINGVYSFVDLPVLTGTDTYTIKACFVQNGVSFFDILTSQMPPATGAWTENLRLVQRPCS